MTIPTYEVIALKMGELEVDKSTITSATDFGQLIKVPIWSVLILGGEHKILVDTGIHSREADL